MPSQQISGLGEAVYRALTGLSASSVSVFQPVCSFAYGLSREGARKALEYAGNGKGEAFDIRLMETCKARELSCISVVPELFHQYFPPERFGVKSEVDIGNGEHIEVSEAEFENHMGSMENILESARCRALFGRSCLKVI